MSEIPELLAPKTRPGASSVIFSAQVQAMDRITFQVEGGSLPRTAACGLLQNGQVNGTSAVLARSPWWLLDHTLETTDC